MVNPNIFPDLPKFSKANDCLSNLRSSSRSPSAASAFSWSSGAASVIATRNLAETTTDEATGSTVAIATDLTNGTVANSRHDDSLYTSEVLPANEKIVLKGKSPEKHEGASHSVPTPEIATFELSMPTEAVRKECLTSDNITYAEASLECLPPDSILDNTRVADETEVGNSNNHRPISRASVMEKIQSFQFNKWLRQIYRKTKKRVARLGGRARSQRVLTKKQLGKQPEASVIQT
jgi:hypothetical protein